MDALGTAKDILANCLFIPADKIGDDAGLYDLKPVDSVTFETLVLEIEERTGKEVDVEALLSMRTVRDLAALIAGSRGSSIQDAARP
ncbi:acyl carrier protein [Labrys neptuniae]